MGRTVIYMVVSLLLGALTACNNKQVISSHANKSKRNQNPIGIPY